MLPSEDELAEALVNGDIDSVQYVILRDIIENGIDSTNRYLLDEIPNLFDFGISEGSFVPALEGEQEKPFRKENAVGRKRGVLGYRFYQDLHDDDRNKYQSTLTFDLDRRWRLALKINRELDGRERFTGRSVAYRRDEGPVRSFVLGNYTARFGLGTVYGYHSRLFESYDGLEKESLLFPDNSALNGGYAELRIRGFDISALAAVDRDTVFSMTSLGAMVGYKRGDVTVSLPVGLNRLKKRNGGEYTDDNKIGLFARYDYNRGYAALEICGGAGVFEGRHHFGPAEIRFSGWSYAGDYRALTAGSRAAGIRRTRTIEPLGFEYSDKRAGQTGLLLKTVTRPRPGIEMFNSVLAAAVNEDTANIDILTGLSRKSGGRREISVDYLYKNRKRITDRSREIAHEHRLRLELKFKTGLLSLRNYIAFDKKTDGEDYFSFFARVKVESSDLGNIELWSNCRLTNDGVCRYWYGYLKSDQRINGEITLIMKLGNRYSRDSEEKHKPFVSFEVKAII